MLPDAPPSAVKLLMGVGPDVQRAHSLPEPDRLPQGELRDAVTRCKAAADVYASVREQAKSLLDQRRDVHADDQRAQTRAIQGGKREPVEKLLARDAKLDDAARSMDGHARAVAGRLAELDALGDDAWKTAARDVRKQVQAAIDNAAAALDDAHAALADVQAWGQIGDAGGLPAVWCAMSYADLVAGVSVEPVPLPAAG